MTILIIRNQKGKANFFMLDQFNGQAVLNDVPAGTIAALSVVEVEPKYQSLINYLLGQVVIADDENNLSKYFDSVIGKVKTETLPLSKTEEFIKIMG